MIANRDIKTVGEAILRSAGLGRQAMREERYREALSHADALCRAASAPDIPVSFSRCAYDAFKSISDTCSIEIRRENGNSVA